jgi:hypothetical protein
LFEEYSEEISLMRKCYDNATEFDFISYLGSLKIDDAEEHFDVNRVMKLKDRMQAVESGPLVELVVARLKKAGKDTVPSEMIS